MTNLQMLCDVFRDALLLDEATELTGIAYGTTPTWDSVAHMQLIAAIETEFGIMLETDEVIAMSDFKVAQDLLTAKITASDSMLEGRTAYITGATRGIGASIARTFAANGATVLVNGRNADRMNAFTTELRAEFGVECTGILADQRDPAAIRGSFQEIFRRYGRLDVMVNNAGIVDDGLLGMISDESVSATYEVNALAVIHNIQGAARLMQRSGSGSIINISSVMGLRGNVGQVVYSGSKAAVIGSTKAAAKELAPSNIRVNAIAPGLIETDFVRDMPERKFEERLASIAMGRIGTPQDVANVALFLASDLSSYVTGQTIGVDGAMVI